MSNKVKATLTVSFEIEFEDNGELDIADQAIEEFENEIPSELKENMDILRVFTVQGLTQKYTPKIKSK